jgi:hypothetical protein
MRLRGAALALAASLGGASTMQSVTSPSRHAQHAPLQRTTPLHAAPLQAAPAPPVLFQNLLPPDSVCANKTWAGFFAFGRDPACPCDCIGCKCRRGALMALAEGAHAKLARLHALTRMPRCAQHAARTLHAGSAIRRRASSRRSTSATRARAAILTRTRSRASGCTCGRLRSTAPWCDAAAACSTHRITSSLAPRRLRRFHHRRPTRRHRRRPRRRRRRRRGRHGHPCQCSPFTELTAVPARHSSSRWCLSRSPCTAQASAWAAWALAALAVWALAVWAVSASAVWVWAPRACTRLQPSCLASRPRWAAWAASAPWGSQEARASDRPSCKRCCFTRG